MAPATTAAAAVARSSASTTPTSSQPGAARRGRLPPPSAAPATGEQIDVLVEGAGVVIEHILSSEIDGKLEYLQDHDEWVTLLAGEAVLDVGDEQVALGPGDWIVLPGRVPHSLRRAAAGTSWLTVHLPRP